MAKFAVIARESLIDLLRRAKKGSQVVENEGRRSGEGVLQSYSKWKKNIAGRTQALKYYRSKTGSAPSSGKVLIPKDLLDELRNTSSEKNWDEELFRKPRK